MSGLIRFVIFRLFGARVLLVLGILGWLRNRLRPRSSAVDDEARRTRTTTRRPG